MATEEKKKEAKKEVKKEKTPKAEKKSAVVVDRMKAYSLSEAIDLLKAAARAKFDESVELHIRLGVDVKQSDQQVRATALLPHGTGKSKRVVVIAKGEKLKEALQAGADFVGEADLIEKLAKGWTDFDILVATPDVMKDLAKLGKVLGPKGLMPNPKTGTVTFDLARTVKELKTGRIEFRADATGIVHTAVGKVSFDKQKIAENVKALYDAVVSAKPSGAKGSYILSVSISSTMGPGIRLATNLN
ncbi:MAG: 50S ribosomal protein L1 [Elusimicrobiota bacterium]